MRFLQALSLIAAALLAGGPAYALQLTGLNDISLSDGWSSGGIDRSVELCVVDESGQASGYTVTASQPGGFWLTGQGTNIAFDLYWRAGGGWSRLLNGTTSESTFPINCTSTGVRLTIDETALSGVPAGSYQGSINFQLVPQ